jgi:hypothetical protein
MHVLVGHSSRELSLRTISNETPRQLYFYRSVLSVLKWSLEIRKDIQNSDQGAIFSPTFVRDALYEDFIT